MYAVDGAFGQVRHVPIPLGGEPGNVPFPLCAAGWHKCNDLYHISRENGSDTHLLLFSLTDGGCITVGDECFSLPKHAAAWLPPHVKQDYRTAPGAIWEMYWLHLQDVPWLQFGALFRDSHWMPLSCMDSIRELFESMLRDRRKTPAAFWADSSHCISELYHLLLRESLTHQANNGAGDALVRTILRDMEYACQESWNLEQMAARYFLSVPQLIRRFKKETGMTPHACLTQIRLRTAELYLTYTLLSVEEIARKTGFSGTSNFISQYRKAYGTTPHQYRSKK